MKLIKLQDKFILVSNEEIKEGDWVLVNKDDIMQVKSSYDNDCTHENIWVGDSLNGYATYIEDCKKIIAGIPELPKVDFSLLKEEDCKELKLSTIDLTNLCYYDQRNPDFEIKEEFGYDKEEVDATGNFAKKDCACDNCFYGRTKLTEQFITAQSLNEGCFSLEDMEYAIKEAYLSGVERNNYDEQLKNDIIQSLQQTSWEVEVEMEVFTETIGTSEFDFMEQDNVRPKITNNSIKVTKIL